MPLEFYSAIDLNKNELQNTVIQNLSTAPGSPAEGQIYYDDSNGDKQVYVYNGSAWVPMGGDINSVVAGAGMTGGATAGEATLNVIGTSGAITVSANAITLPSALTVPASMTNAALKLGRDGHNFMDFGTDNVIKFTVSTGQAITFKADGEIEATKFDGALEGNADTATKIASITNTDIVQLGESQTLTNKTIAISQVTELSGLTEAEGTQLEAIGTTTISANQWGYLGALTTDVQTELDKLQTLTTAEVDQLENINSVTITNAQWGYLGAATGAITNTNTETTTVLSLPGGNVLRYVDEAGNTTNLDISSYLDDTNLARLTSGSLNGSNGVATFTRDDSSTFTIDMSDFLDAITLNNTLTSTSTTQGLTANQGKVLKGLIDALVTSTGTNTGDEPDASHSVKGIIELATHTEVQVGIDAGRAVTPDNLAAKSVTATIAQSSITDTKTVTITHNLGTADVIVQLFDMTTEANIYADIYRTAADMSTASTSVITVDFGAVTPPNDIRCLITSIKGATAAPTIAYT
jgi:hypothetical protein